ncbi:uncharacterized protein [Miscanthus floridulus]|uniref:uncharacterized protein isoform X2 n=1 Tax=Miscanthus floridulus TaxID=154761 RepID=UPI003457CAF8
MEPMLDWVPAVGAVPVTDGASAAGAAYSMAADQGAGEGAGGVVGRRRPPWYPPPAALPPAASTGLFSLMPFDPSCLSWLSELSPFLPSAGTRAAAARLGQAPFAPSPCSSLLLSTNHVVAGHRLRARVLQQHQLPGPEFSFSKKLFSVSMD